MDEDDVRILHWLHVQPGSTSTEIAKAVFKPKGYSDVKVDDRRTRNRLERLAESGLVLAEGKPRRWRTNPSRAREKVIHATDPLSLEVEKLGPALVVQLDQGILIVPLT